MHFAILYKPGEILQSCGEFPASTARAYALLIHRQGEEEEEEEETETETTAFTSDLQSFGIVSQKLVPIPPREGNFNLAPKQIDWANLICPRRSASSTIIRDASKLHFKDDASNN